MYIIIALAACMYMYVRAGSHHGARWKGRVEATMDLGYPGHAWAAGQEEVSTSTSVPAGEGISQQWLAVSCACVSVCVCSIQRACPPYMAHVTIQAQVSNGLDPCTRLRASSAKCHGAMPQRRKRWRSRTWKSRGQKRRLHAGRSTWRQLPRVKRPAGREMKTSRSIK